MCTIVYYVQDILYPFLIGFAHPGPGRMSLIEQHILPNCWSAGMGFQLSPNAAICCHILISSTAPTVIFAATIMSLESAESAALMFPPDGMPHRYELSSWCHLLLAWLVLVLQHLPMLYTSSAWPLATGLARATDALTPDAPTFNAHQGQISLACSPGIEARRVLCVTLLLKGLFATGLARATDALTPDAPNFSVHQDPYH